MRAGDLPPDSGFFALDDPSTPSDESDKLVLYFSSVAQECPPPIIEATCENAPIWQFILVLPPELDTPGLIDLATAPVPFRETLSFVGDSGSCGGFGGGMGPSYGRGTLEIVSTDETSLFVKLRGVGAKNQASGDYTVQRCGAATEQLPGG